MNKIITLPTLVALVAERAGITISEAERFINAFTALTGDALADAEQVKIKGIGTFRLNDMGPSPIAFMPDPDLAAKVNEPFSFFEAVELNDGVTEEMLSAINESSEPKDATEIVDAPAPSTPEEPDNTDTTENEPPEPETEPVVEPEPETEPAIEPEPQPEVETHDATPANVVEEPAEDNAEDENVEGYDEDYSRQEGSFFPTFWVVWASAIGVIIGFAVGFFAHDAIMDKFFPVEIVSEETEEPENTMEIAEEVEAVDTILPASSDSVATPSTPVETIAPQTEVYDTITQSTFLTTLAYKHYGKKDYWIYIYLENQDQLKHPDKIRPGTRVRIPAKEKYATASSEEENVRAARNKAAEIYRKYK